MVVIGLGSPFLSDDSVGPRVVRELSRRDLHDVRLVESHAGGLLLLEELDGVQWAVIVDALLDGRRTPGEIVMTDIDTASNNISCSHDCSLPEALTIGRAMGMSLPDNDAIRLVGIVAKDVTTLSETLSLPVAAAVSKACDMICAFIEAKDSLPAAEMV